MFMQSPTLSLGTAQLGVEIIYITDASPPGAPDSPLFLKG